MEYLREIKSRRNYGKRKLEKKLIRFSISQNFFLIFSVFQYLSEILCFSIVTMKLSLAVTFLFMNLSIGCGHALDWNYDLSDTDIGPNNWGGYIDSSTGTVRHTRSIENFILLLNVN